MPARPFSLNSWIVGTAILATITAMAMDRVDLDIAVTVAAWVLPDAIFHMSTNNSHRNSVNVNHRLLPPCSIDRRRSLLMARDEAAEQSSSSLSPSPSPMPMSMSFLESAEWTILEDLHEKASKKAADNDDGISSFQAASEELLPALSSTLIMKLRSGDKLIPSDASEEKSNARLLKIYSEISEALNTMTDNRLESARDVLK